MVVSLRPTPVSDWKFKKEWNDFYSTGDLYAEEKQQIYRRQWEIKTDAHNYPYLDHIKTIAPAWRPLRYLADFMEVGTDPLRWKDFNNSDKNHRYTYPDDLAGREEKRSERVSRSRVCLLDYEENEATPDVTYFERPIDLRYKLVEMTREKDHHPTSGLKLFVVEDLSRDTIELLGHYLQIEPDFFRSHLREHAWFNIRDPFWVAPSLHMDVASRNWHQIFFCRARYFTDLAKFREAQRAVDDFNIKRKLDEDESKALWDRSYPTSKPIFPQLHTSLFRRRKKTEAIPERDSHGGQKNISGEQGIPLDEIQTASEQQELIEEEVDAKVGLMRTKATFWWKNKNIGVLLLDPTLAGGFPLWREQENWHEKPMPGEAAPRTPAPDLSFADRFIYWAENPAPFLAKAGSSNDPRQLPMMVLLRIICADWITMSQYIKTRLSQVDWELIHPREFLGHHRFYTILNKLHTWRRLVPVYREMLYTTASHMEFFLNSEGQQIKGVENQPFMEYLNEFKLILKQMDEYEQRIDRLTAVTTSTINMVDSHRVKILTGLATVFLPLSLIGTLFSMSEDVSKLGVTFGYWSAASVCIICLLLLVYGLSENWLA
ncbi:unnamed protein product [Clonostachys rosea]|uniref:SPX domain-containing protein n=1 Tax=Bionectria ochroleuca TaxID=29856 RepID=A0ABY6UNJ6_BIOOC|nr:unnamed protein product [Clonostachys rosea]